MTEKPVAIVLLNWNPNEPRFIIKDCPKCSDDRVFKNGKSVYNQRLSFAYSVDEIVEVLNTLGNTNDELKKEIEQLKQQIAELQYSKKMLRATNKDLELGIRRLRKSFDDFDKMRVEHIRFLQKRMKKYGISIYYNDGDDE